MMESITDLFCIFHHICTDAFKDIPSNFLQFWQNLIYAGQLDYMIFVTNWQAESATTMLKTLDKIKCLRLQGIKMDVQDQ